LGSNIGQFNSPRKIAVDDFPRVYVTDYFNSRVQKFEADGTYIVQWGTGGAGAGHFNGPIGIAVDKKRQIVYVTENGNNRAQSFTLLGEWVATWGTGGSAQLNSPDDVSIDQRGSMYVADTLNKRVAIFDDNGSYQTSFGAAGSGDGQFVMLEGISVNSVDGQLWTAEANHSRLQRFGSPNPKNDTFGIYRASTQTFLLRNSNTTGYADLNVQFAYGQAGDQPVAGDWNGDGVSTMGVYRDNVFNLWDANTSTLSAPNYVFSLGVAGWIPFVGDWNGDGKSGVGVFNPGNGLIYLKNDLSTGFGDYTMVLGIPGDLPVGGDWNADGQDSPGVCRPSMIRFYLSNKATTGSAFGDYEVAFGLPSYLPFVGDWAHTGVSGLGASAPAAANST